MCLQGAESYLSICFFLNYSIYHLYCSETLKVPASINKRSDVFQQRCLHQILKIPYFDQTKKCSKGVSPANYTTLSYAKDSNLQMIFSAWRTTESPKWYEMTHPPPMANNQEDTFKIHGEKCSWKLQKL